MKYELIQSTISPENTLENYEYEVTITLWLHPTDNIAPNFSKEIKVISNNSQTGFEVNVQREQSIQDYIIQINQ